MDSVIKFQQEDGWFILPDGENCKDLESAINSYYGLNFCSCGSRDEVFEMILKVLNYCHERFAEHNSGFPYDWLEKNIFHGDSIISLFVLYVLESLGITEHGSSVRGSWLTEKGKALREDLTKLN